MTDWRNPFSEMGMTDDEVEEELAKLRLMNPTWAGLTHARMDIEEPRRAMLALVVAVENAKAAYLDAIEHKLPRMEYSKEKTDED